VSPELVCNESTTKALFVATRHKNKIQHLLENLGDIAKKNNVHLLAESLRSGMLFILSTKTINENEMSALMLDVESKYNDFYNRLTETLDTSSTVAEFNKAIRTKANAWVAASGGTETPFTTKNGRKILYCYNPAEDKHAYVDLDADIVLSDEDAWKILGEDQRKMVSSVLNRASSANQFPQSINRRSDIVSGKIGKKGKSTKAKIDEALEGIATPDDAVQPQEGISRLKQALNEPTAAGVTLAQSLKKVGVQINIAKPGGHIVTFLKDGQELWRVESISLADKKTLAETLSSLWSIAAGKAPNARQMELDAKKQAAQDAREAESELENIASKYAPDDADIQQQDTQPRL